MFKNFEYPAEADPLLFSQLCVNLYSSIIPTVVSEIYEKGLVSSKSVITNENGKTIIKQ